MDGSELFDQIKKVSRGLGIVDISVASTDLWETDLIVKDRIKAGNRPKDIMPSARSVIVIGIPIQRAILETAPSIYYHQLYDTVNRALDDATERIALELNILGHEAIFVPRDGYHGITGLRVVPASFFSHRHAAYLAGMGTFGYNNTILTKKYGPRIRFSSVITSAELPSSEPMSYNLCIKCKKCTRDCPVGAVPDINYPKGITQKNKCVEHSAELSERGISPCGICIKTCPVGMDSSDTVPDQKFIDDAKSYVKPLKQ